MKYEPVSDERFVVTDKVYPAPLRIILDPDLNTEVFSIDSRPTDCENPNDLIKRYSNYARCRAGSDNCSNAGRSCGRRNSQSMNGGRTSRSGSQSAQPGPSGCPCRPEQSRRLDMSNRPSQARSSRNRRCTYDVQPPPCGDQNARRGTYDVEPEPQNNRRGTYDVSQPCAAIQQNDRRGTYDVSQPCSAIQRNACSDVQPQRESNCGRSEGSTFTLTGTFQLLGTGFQGLSPTRNQQRARSSSCSRLQDTDGDIDDYLDNHLNYDMVAPRAVALPGQPYVPIDESDANTTPDIWRMTLDHRSSVQGSQGLGIFSPAAYDDFSGSRDTSGRRQWPSAERQSMPFGLNDSFAMSGTSTPRSRQSRARSVAPECGSSRSNRRRDTFDRNTR
ncbi:uncharacterized protein LOC111026365 [Myzus persicae]|uniref:uncharacterized protein LOC111026365 n=1 Tax=Myzus persicae TaxID=13164 RepID=UPI000B93394E|nr:uncharacterized protein LOC111026365 [Myzus persicae]